MIKISYLCILFLLRTRFPSYSLKLIFQIILGKPSDRNTLGPNRPHVPKPSKPGKPIPKPTNIPVGSGRSNSGGSGATSRGHNTNGAPDICQDATIDAVTVLGNGSTYAFKGKQSTEDILC